MADDLVQLSTPQGIKSIDNESLLVSGLLVDRQRIIIADPSNPVGKQRVGGEGAAMVSSGGVVYFRIPAGTTLATVIKNLPGRLCRVISTSGVPETVTYTFYDDPAGGANNKIATIVPNTSDTPADLQIPTVNGISVIPSAATTYDVLVLYL